MKNKRGYGLPNIMLIFTLILVVMILAMAQNGIDTSTIDKTIETLNWTKIGGDTMNTIQTASDNSPNEPTKVILGIVNKAADFFGYSVFEVSKLAMSLARDNPDIINYRVLLALIILSLLAPLIYPAFIITVSLILIIKEYFKNKKEKKELQKIKEKNKVII